MRLKLAAKYPQVGDVTTLVFEPGQPLTWQPGQYMHYVLPHDDADDRGTERWFTIASAPYEGKLCITTRFFDKPSSFKRHLHDLSIGDEIEADGPEGDFTIEDASKSYVWVAGGIGITPFYSMTKQAVHDGQRLNVQLLYGNRDAVTAVHKDELDQWAPQLGITIDYVYEPDRITADTIKAITDYQSKTYYVSGPEPMVKAFAKTLDELGISKEQQKHDDFPGYE